MPAGFFADGRRAALSLSFDDARLTQVDTGLDLLGELGLAATFYVSPDRMRQRLDGWKKAVAACHEIGNHTVSHPCSINFAWCRGNGLEGYTLARMEGEIVSANQIIQHELGVTPTTFAYPCGQTFVGRGANHASYVPLVARYFQVGRGYLAETANEPTLCDLAHVFCYGFDGQPFARIRPLIDQAIADRTWLIFAGHEIGEGAQATLIPMLRELGAYCRQRQDALWVDTVANVGSYIARHRDN